jgi:hypothetical protein
MLDLPRVDTPIVLSEAIARVLKAPFTNVRCILWLQDLIEDKISSCYSMTEPLGGADPKTFKTQAVQV